MDYRVFFFLFLFVAGCGSGKNTAPDLEGFEQMAGTWISNAGGQTFTETWTVSDQRMYGQGYLIKNGDTLFGEKLIVEKVGNRLVYIADVPGQDPVMFVRKGKSKSYRFENPEHDFPCVITYEPQMNGPEVNIVLQGSENGREKSGENDV